MLSRPLNCFVPGHGSFAYFISFGHGHKSCKHICMKALEFSRIYGAEKKLESLIKGFRKFSQKSDLQNDAADITGLFSSLHCTVDSYYH